MKKIMFICIVLFTMFSCSDDTSQVTSSKIESVKRVKNNDDEQRVAYLLLNANERFSLWNEKINWLLKENNLNSKQKDLIMELQSTMKASYFSEQKSDEKEYFKALFVPAYLKKLQQEFSNTEIENMFYTVSRIALPLDNIMIDIPGGGDVRKNCNCNNGSLVGCGSFNKCATNEPCNVSNSGCGFLFFWECNGICRII